MELSALIAMLTTLLTGGSDLTSPQVDPLMAEFQAWQVKFNKKYGSNEQDRRFAIFKENHGFINEVNAQNLSYTLGHNEFMDLSFDEFAMLKTGVHSHIAADAARIIGHESQKDEIDWRQHNVVTPVKNQGQCGSCWAFSTTGALEGLHAIETGDLVEFSEQALVDCSTKNYGCNGGAMVYAFEFVEQNGIPLESDYTYQGFQGQCQQYNSAYTVGSWKMVPQGEPAQMKAVLNIQPVSVGIAVNRTLQFYRGGVFEDCGDQINHGVLAVGYGTDEDLGDYWLVKNSWSSQWGEEGYIRIRRTSESGENYCNILDAAVYPRP